MTVMLDFSMEVLRESDGLIEGSKKRLFDKAQFVFSEKYCIEDSMHRFLKDFLTADFNDYEGGMTAVDFAYTIVKNVVGFNRDACIAFPLFACTNSCGGRSYESFTTYEISDNMDDFVGVMYVLVDDLKTREELYELNDVHIRGKEFMEKILRLLDDVSFYSKYKYSITIRKNNMARTNTFRCADSFVQEDECLRNSHYMLGELIPECARCEI